MERSCVWPRVLVVSHWAAWVELRRGQRQLHQSSVGQRSQDFCPRHCLCCKLYLLTVVWRDNSVCVCTGVWREDEDRERERVCVFGSFCAFRRELLVCDCTSGFFFFNYYHFFQWVCTSFSSFSSPMFFDGTQTPTLNPKAESLFFFHFILYVVSLNLHFK